MADAMALDDDAGAPAESPYFTKRVGGGFPFNLGDMKHISCEDDTNGKRCLRLRHMRNLGKGILLSPKRTDAVFGTAAALVEGLTALHAKLRETRLALSARCFFPLLVRFALRKLDLF